MSLYNMLFGQNPLSGVLLKVTGLTPLEIPRFRDAYLEGDQVVVYTRTGGGNDECYCEQEEGHEEGCYFQANRKLEAKENFISMEYDDFDSTYAYFKFHVLHEYQEYLPELKLILGENPPQKVSDKFEEFLKKLK